MNASGLAAIAFWGAIVLAGRPALAEPPGAEPVATILQAGKWTSAADDTESGERIPWAFVERLVKAHKNNPNDKQAIADLGLLSLTIAVGEWGVEPDPARPPDPMKGDWAGPPHRSGKHLMSYARGGVGLPHADAGFLQDLMERLGCRDGGPPMDARFCALKGTNFDKLLARGGHCVQPPAVIAVDLSGQPFGHAPMGFAGAAYCATYDKGTTTPEDWRVFRHHMRDALRQRDVQTWLIESWTERYWMPSYRAVMQAGGSAEEALVNARIRNSSSVTANKAAGHRTLTTLTATDPVERQLEVYNRADRRGYLLRAAVLYRAVAQ